jgi:hypothetical protein
MKHVQNQSFGSKPFGSNSPRLTGFGATPFGADRLGAEAVHNTQNMNLTTQQAALFINETDTYYLDYVRPTMKQKLLFLCLVEQYGLHWFHLLFGSLFCKLDITDATQLKVISMFTWSEYDITCVDRLGMLNSMAWRMWELENPDKDAEPEQKQYEEMKGEELQ